jgi:post-segregation antitoxin (ccd killing protein)
VVVLLNLKRSMKMKVTKEDVEKARADYYDVKAAVKGDVEKAKADYEEQWRAALVVARAAADKHWDKYWKLKKEYEANENGN